jgi:hypothetical protein
MASRQRSRPLVVNPSDRPDIDPAKEAVLRDELSAVLAGDLGQLAKEEGLDVARVRVEALEDAPTILEAAAPAWQKLREAQREHQRLQAIAAVPRRWARRASSLVRPARLVSIGLLAAAAAQLLAVTDVIPGSNLSFFALPVGVGLAAAALTFALAVAIYNAMASRLPEPLEFESVSELLEAAEENYRTTLRQAGIETWLRERINAARGLSYATRLSYSDASGLAEIDDRSHEISTEAKRRLARMMETMPGGAIGLAGTRGAGKSTLMRSVCRAQGEDDDALSVVLDAPVQYDPREFVLHLFAQLCTEILGPDKVRRLRGWTRPPSPEPRSRYLGPLLTLLGILSIIAGAAILLGPAWDFSSLLESRAFGFGLIGVGYILTLAGTFRAWPQALRVSLGPFGVTLSGEEEDDHADDGDDDPEATAELRLHQIWFQQSFSSGWSGSLKVPVGLEAGLSASRELSEQQLSFPDIVGLLREFLELVSSRRQVRIGIDELDKMDDEAACRFLNEIKVIFRVPRCFFLVSISEDAMSSFERRGLPFRDVFDSSFDDVLSVPHLDFEHSQALLERRIVDLPLPFTGLLHCLSAGLPRDLIRSARDMTELQQGMSLDGVTARLLRDTLGAKAEAARVAARRFESEDHTALLSSWLAELGEAGADADRLLAVCRGFERRFLAPLAATRDEDAPQGERREAQRVATQVVTYAYFAATVTQLFARFGDKRFVDRALGIEGAGESPRIADRLADVPQLFAADLSAAWEALSDLRRDLGLTQAAFPRRRSRWSAARRSLTNSR